MDAEVFFFLFLKKTNNVIKNANFEQRLFFQVHIWL